MSTRNNRDEDGGRRTVRDASERAERRASEYASPLFKELKGAQWYKVKEAHEVTVSIVPYKVKYATKYNEVGDYDYTKTYYVHKALGPQGKDRMLCMHSTFGEQCAVCDFGAKAARSPSPSTRAAAADILKTQERNLYRFLIVGREDEGLFVLDISRFSFQKLLEEQLRRPRAKQMGWNNFASLGKDGFDLILNFTEEAMGAGKKGDKPSAKGGKQTYIKVGSIEFVPRRRAIDEAWMDSKPNLDLLLKHDTYEEQETNFASIGAPSGREESHDDEDERPAPKSKKPAADEDEDDYEQPPKKAAKKPARSADDDYEDEDIPVAPKKKPARPAADEDDE